MDHAAPSYPMAPELVDRLVDDYLAAWNETDDARRLVLLQRCWDAAGSYVDPTVEIEGRAPLADHIARVQARRPGARLEVVGPVDRHHQFARFDWRLVSPDRSTGPVSTDVAEIGSTGLLVRVTGFFGS